ncbi:MAG TPA: hypothetical protein DCY91_24520 [Cyanobacteria bacterium UBA11370]|nr:hypothetical protein [Cyanobacteria bacterium UBA11370]HBY77004.1 hypothetical protein [Cyanobacteria bacterium UBA11148]
MQRRVSAIALLSLFLIAAVLPPTLASTVTENRLTHTKLQFLVKRSFSPHPPIPPSPYPIYLLSLNATRYQPSFNAENLVQQGRALYEAEQFNDAVRILQQAAAAFTASGDERRLAMTLSNLSLAYQQLGLWTEAEQAIAQSLNLLQNLDNSKERSEILAQTLDVQGRLQLARGQAESALKTWQQAADIYIKIGDQTPLTRNRINQAQALQGLGLYRLAQKTLTEVKQTLQSQPDSFLKSLSLCRLGNVLRVVGNLEESRQVLEQSLAVARALDSNQAIGEALLGLGNTARAQQDNQAALNFYQQATAPSVPTATRIQAHLNQLSLLLLTKQLSAAQRHSSEIHSQINTLPPSRMTVYAKINLAQSLVQLKQNRATDTPSWVDIAQLVATAVQQAQGLEDRRAESYTLGILGWLYEQTEQLSNALDLTENALLIAQAIDASDITYQWQWQLGRLLKMKGDIKGAIAAYEEAVKTLQSLRNDLVAINPDVQFSFREEVEPVYRQLVDLLLRPQGSREPSQENLQKARNTIESLQLAELENFLRQACLADKVAIDKVIDQDDRAAAVFYPIILPDRLEVILKLSQQPLHHYAIPISQSQVENILDQLRQNLTEPDTQREAKSLSQQVYNWLIQPVATDLAQSQIQTLVFVLDGSLRNIPIAALYDGQQYLIETYGIALAPGLQLVDPKPLERRRFKALIAGLTEARHGFRRLNYVEKELAQIQSEVPTRVLLNQQFTTQAFQNQVNDEPFPVVHLATHGQFSSSADKTFILAWDKPIKVNELNSLLRTRDQRQSEPIELLVLSACETATGDKRAALGLAGVAVRAGARSTLASLWSVDDASTAMLMSQFYQELANHQLTTAEALRRAQLALLQNPLYQRPLFWAPYVLVGNWL